MKVQGTPKEWSVDRSKDYYYVPYWGGGYFNVNEKGHISIQPMGTVDGPSIDIMDVMEDLREKEIGLPCVLRFQDLLRARVIEINEAFNSAIQELDYKGGYRGVYPIKVNQMREVVEEILDAGAPYHYGLEAGSKAEILPVLAFNTDPEALTICNGYKDEEFLRLALLGRKIGRKVIVVIEKLSELPHILDLSEEMGVEPMIGIRARLSSKGAGKWLQSSGELAKFGLTVPEIIQAVEILKARGMERCAKLFHFHIGTQIPDILRVKGAVQEGARIYAKLHKMGLNIEYFDVGGGLGVDYDGSQTTFPSSMNYTMKQYASDVAYILQQICQSEKVPEPNIVSESGRAITAHHSVLVTNVFGSIQTGQIEGASATSFLDKLPAEEEVTQVREMRYILNSLTENNAIEWYHDALAKKEETLNAFNLGIVSLVDRAKVEGLFAELLKKLLPMMDQMKRKPEEAEEIKSFLCNQYMANFSLFQTAPDFWGCGQLFPIVPLHRLNEEPTVESTVVDITCDSDGKIDRFIDREDVKSRLLIHPLQPGEPYYVGMFLIGAYQDIMGDMHNCFGRVNEVHIFMDDEDPEDFYIEEIIRGDTAEMVLSRLQYSPSELVRMVKSSIDEKVREGVIRPKEGVQLIDSYEDSIRGYTYLNSYKG